LTQFNKLVDRILALPAEAEFRDVRRLLEAYGWTLSRRKGSHVSFTKSGEQHIVVALMRGRKVKRVYLRSIINRLGLND